MKGAILCSLCLLVLVFVSYSTACGRDVKSSRYYLKELLPEEEDPRALDNVAPLVTEAATDTFCLVWYNFEDDDWQGFTQLDMTAQRGYYFHADDFLGLAGGDYGLLYPVEGAISIWCGVRKETDNYSCGFTDPPGYGNNWHQMLVTEPFDISGMVYLSYHGVFDSEPDYDYTYVQYDLGEGNWVTVEAWDVFATDTVVTHEMAIPKSETKLRFYFTSDTGWSDEDGSINTDGACILDSITIWYDTGTITQVDYEDFEGWTVGATDMGEASLWHAEIGESYGSYIGLMSNLQDKDPCNDNYTSQIVFFIGSPHASASYPGLYDTPFCQGPGGITAPCQFEYAVSPVIDMTKYSTGRNNIQDADIPAEDLADLGGTIFGVTTYVDLPLSNFVFFTWNVRSIDPVTLCPGPWKGQGWFYYGKPRYVYRDLDISDIMGGDPIQVAVGCIDYCEAKYSNPGDCLYHTPAPWIDNIRVYRYKKIGPQWNYWGGVFLFHDNFPEDEYDVESFVRADMAADLAPETAAYITIGDSVALKCSSPMGGGIRENGNGGEVYMHVRVTDVSGFLGKPNLYGPQLQGTYGIYVEDDGAEWTIIQCDTAKIQYTKPVADFWMVDLNDSLLTRGYIVEYYFEAFDNEGAGSTAPPSADQGAYFEFTCLPTGRSNVLYVNDSGRTSQAYWDPTFEAVIPSEAQPDHYDIFGSSSLLGNGLASRATLNQLMYNEIVRSGYSIIIYDCGSNLTTIGDGSENGDKADDCTILANWLDQSDNDVGLLICGDEVAWDFATNLQTTQAFMLMSSWCGVSYSANSYFELTGGLEGGGTMAPLITGANSGIFWNDGSPYQYYAFGGCPTWRDFDVLQTTAEGVEALMYPDYDSEFYVAGIQSSQPNNAGSTARTMWLGHSWSNVRDTGPDSPMIRNLLFSSIYSWFQGTPNSNITPVLGIPCVYRLAQNFPNPFNPVTTIKFEMKKKGHVSLNIYNVAGQLVKTLVDEVLEAGPHSEKWKGTNNEGVDVASGIYFYQMIAEDYHATRKMVLLR